MAQQVWLESLRSPVIIGFKSIHPQGTCMIKMVLLTIPVILLVVAQGTFIYGVGNGGAAQFIATWHSFSINQTGYSKFVFSTISIWWVFPAICTLALVWSWYKSLAKLTALTLLFSLVGTIALYWSAYAPELLVTL